MPHPFPATLKAKIANFAEHRAAYVQGNYNETQVRREYIDPFFEALGWDIANKEGSAQAYQDVVHEDKVKVGGATKAPDYSFRIGGTRKFFVEAKKPSVDIKDDCEPAFQLRRYAFSAGLALSILTDFDEFAVYDCRHKPSPKDKPGKHRLFYCKFDEYEKHWDFIAGHFSREAIKKGAFDKLAQEKGGKRKGTATVDAEFLAQLEIWREDLAQNLALRNPDLDTEGLNFSVQATLDRLVFLRIAEDRGIEPLFQLQGSVNGTGVYGRLCGIFRHADRKYNSGLFHFDEDEKGRDGHADTLTGSLQIDDKVLAGIIKGMYPPECPFAFEVMPAEILGSAYERFLGKVIRLTDGHRAKVEDKPEVKKAGGVFYTPAYIVQHIVRATLDPLLVGKTAAQALKLRVLDPACGSGSFLLGAYQYLLDWHLTELLKDTDKNKSGKHPHLVETQGGWRLSARYRKELLTSCLFGVDIDAQAVEVTKLSLLLKVLEGETEATLGNQFKLFAERALPDLDANIRCGNSLIGPDFYTSMLVDTLTDAERKRVNAFDWNASQAGTLGARPYKAAGKKKAESSGLVRPRSQGFGFDAVIGNPPYIRIQALQEFGPLEVEHYKEAYKSAAKGNYDIYVIFVEKGLALLNKGGRLGYILPHKFMNAQYGAPLRAVLSEAKAVESVVHFGDQQVFDSATTYTCLLFLNKGGCEKVAVEKVGDLEAWREGVSGERGEVALEKGEGEWNLSVGGNAELHARIREGRPTLEEVTTRIFQGIKTSADKIYIVEERAEKADEIKIFSPQREEEFWVEKALFHPLIKGGDSRAYAMTRTERRILFPYAKQADGKMGLIPEAVLAKQYPKTLAYFQANKKDLEARENGKMKGPKWYAYIYPKALDVMGLPKIFTPDIAPGASFSYDPTGECFFTGGAAGGYGLLPKDGLDPRYLLALLNSKLLEGMVRETATQFRGGWFSFESRFIRSLPIHVLNLKNKAEKAQHDRIVALVDRVTELKLRLASGGLAPPEMVRVGNEISGIEGEIEGVVVGLYGVNDPRRDK